MLIEIERSWASAWCGSNVSVAKTKKTRIPDDANTGLLRMVLLRDFLILLPPKWICVAWAYI